MSNPTPFSVLSVSLPLGEYGWLYYTVCAFAFSLSGIVFGYFIWRKEHMQTMDAEMEIKLNESELKNHTQEFEKEVKNLDISASDDPVAELLSNFGEEGPQASGQQG